MGPTKAIVKGLALHEAVSGKLIQDGFANRQAVEEYVKHHYIAVPVLDNAGNHGSWMESRSIACMACNTRRSRIRESTLPVAPTAVAWAFARTNSPSNRTAFAALLAAMNSMRDWR